MLGFMAKKASIAVQMLQWKSSSGTVAAGSHTAPRRFPCVPANPAPVLTQQKQESPRARAQLPAVLRELHLPMAPMWCSPAERRRPGMHRETPGNAQLRSCPPTCKTQTQKPGQTSQWTFLPMDNSSPWIIPLRGYSRRQSLQQILSSQSNTGSQASLLSQHHSSEFCPSVHAPEHLVDEGESEPGVLAIPASVLAFFSSEHQEQESFVALLVHRDNEAPLCRRLSAPLALPGYSEEFCRLQDGIKSGR